MIHWYTRKRPSLGQRTIIDNVIKKQLSKLKINDCRVKRGTNCGSVHRLVAAKLVVPYQTSRSGTRTALVPEEQGTSISEDERKIYHLNLLQQESVKHLYQRRLDSALAEAPPSEDIEE
ncbi:hypothetical protein HHI36_009306 [Cryptolaemus montrouzieri]|uniref:Uncharacterized protein n=1 Tax=Cryptolaemus montrouzieri TaxID=559131 RepID=A0ABD2MVD8_9CUCU